MNCCTSPSLDQTNNLFKNYGTINGSSGMAYFNGRFENYGAVNLTAENNPNHRGNSIFHGGYTVINEGTITLAADTWLNINGCVLLNTGKITGDGTLNININYTVSTYDNGIEYVERDSSKPYAPDYYDRYKFVRDPDATVEQLNFYGELQNEGTCTVTVRDYTKAQ